MENEKVSTDANITNTHLLFFCRLLHPRTLAKFSSVDLYKKRRGLERGGNQEKGDG